MSTGGQYLYHSWRMIEMQASMSSWVHWKRDQSHSRLMHRHSRMLYQSAAQGRVMRALEDYVRKARERRAWEWSREVQMNTAQAGLVLHAWRAVTEKSRYEQ